MDAMKTYYKSTEWRGKRGVYASIDPAERKRQTVIGWVAISVVLGFVALFAFYHADPLPIVTEPLCG
jgi:hypothetical protein